MNWEWLESHCRKGPRGTGWQQAQCEAAVCQGKPQQELHQTQLRKAIVFLFLYCEYTTPCYLGNFCDCFAFCFFLSSCCTSNVTLTYLTHFSLPINFASYPEVNEIVSLKQALSFFCDWALFTCLFLNESSYDHCEFSIVSVCESYSEHRHQTLKFRKSKNSPSFNWTSVGSVLEIGTNVLGHMCWKRCITE